jgi:hypothetical protein
MKIRIEQTGKDVIVLTKVTIEHNGKVFESSDSRLALHEFATNEVETIDNVSKVELYQNSPSIIVFNNGNKLKFNTPKGWSVDTRQKMGDIIRDIRDITKKLKEIKTKVKAQLKTTAVYEFEVEL